MILISPIDQSEEELLAQLQHPEYFAQKVERLKPGSRRRLEVLATRVMLKQLCGGEEQRVVYDEHGAPRLVCDSGTAPYLSISHTQGYAAIILSADGPVGIDIEQRGRRVMRVVSHYLMPDEETLLHAVTATDEQYLLALHLAWSAKEAAFKVLGPDYYDLQHLTRITALDWQQRTLTLYVHAQSQPMILHFDYTDDYVLVRTHD